LVILTNLTFALNELGKRRQALELCQQIAEETSAQTIRGLSMAEGAYLPWSLLSLEANELSLARDQATRALHICRQVDITDGVLWSRFILARVALAEGDTGAMRKVCQEARHLAGQTGRGGLHAAWFAALEAQASLQDGDLAAAARWSEEATLTPADVPHRWSEFAYFTYGRLLLAQDRLDEAERLLGTMEQSAQQGERRRNLITIHLQHALVQRAQGRDRQARARMEDALRIAAPQDYRRAFLDEGPPIADLLPSVRHVAPPFVDSLRAFTEKRDQALHGALIEPLTDRELEILRLIAAGQSNPEIARLLYLSLNTVKWHAKNLYGKLGVGSRVEAVNRAQELGLL
jgi:LuxR family maltose regulon positive regulatory protein